MQIIFLSLFPVAWVFMCLSAIWQINSAESGAVNDVLGNSVESSIRFVVELKNQTSTHIESAEVTILKPIALEQRQNVIDIDTKLSSTSPGESVLKFQLESIPPFGQSIITLTASVKTVSSPAMCCSPDEKSLKGGKYLSLDSKEVKGLITELSEQDGMYISNIYQWVKDNVDYSGYIQEDRGALYAIKEKKGDCTEYMYTMLALLRGKGINARGYAGFYLDRANQLVRAKDYHNWIEYYSDGAWRIMDPLNGNFDDGYGKYIVMREVTGEDEGKMTSQRFISHDKRLNISMY